VTAVDRVDKLPAVHLQLEQPFGEVAKHERRLGERLGLVGGRGHAQTFEPSGLDPAHG